MELLYRTNLLALVGGGRSPQYPRNRCIIWDNQTRRLVADIEFVDEVMAVRMRRDRIIVALPTRVFVYHFSTLKILQSYNTDRNPYGELNFPSILLDSPSLSRSHI